MKTITRTVTEKTTTTEKVFSADDVRKALGLPEGASLFVRVPGGGDWSNTELDLDTHPLEATIVTTSREET